MSDSRACNAMRALRLSPKLTAPQKTKSPEELWAPTTSDPTGSAAPGAGKATYHNLTNRSCSMAAGDRTLLPPPPPMRRLLATSGGLHTVETHSDGSLRGL